MSRLVTTRRSSATSVARSASLNPEVARSAYKVKQGTALSAELRTKTTVERSVYPLEVGKGFTIEAQPPFEITSDTHCPIRIELEFKAYETIGGYSRPGSVEGAVGRDGKADLVLAEVVLHEIGHKMTLTGANAAKTASGLAAPKTVDQAGGAYPSNGTKGHAYVAHGHQGPHCAYGLSDADKVELTYNTAVLEPKATCVMFGVVDQRDGSTRKFFCEECVEHIRARDLRDLTT